MNVSGSLAAEKDSAPGEEVISSCGAVPWEHSPVILIGCHRSGTSVITRLLEDLGLFVGNDLEAHHESTSFIRINSWIMRECGGAWDQPEPVRKTLARKKHRSAFADYISKLIRSTHVAPFLGWAKWIGHKIGFGFPTPWGWKDPRTTITLPLWLEIFPDAKVIHISRHGVDVASSLYERQTSRRSADGLARRVDRLKQRLSWNPFQAPLQRHSRLPGSQRCSSLDTSFELWEAYEAEASHHTSVLDDQVKSLKFEDLCTDPIDTLGDLASFVNLNVTTDQLNRVSGIVQSERALAYRNCERLKEFAAQREHRLARFRYSA